MIKVSIRWRPRRGSRNVSKKGGWADRGTEVKIMRKLPFYSRSKRA